MPVYKVKSERGWSWYTDIRINGKRYREHVPEATSEKQAKIAETKRRSELFEGKYFNRKASTPLEMFFNDIYLKWSKDNKATWNRDVYTGKIICDFFKGKSLGEVAPFDVERFKQARTKRLTQRGTPASKSSVNRELAVLSKIFSYAVDNSYLESNPCKKVKFYKVDNIRDRVVQADEEAQLFEALKGTKGFLRHVALLGLYCGMRVGEIANLEWGEVDFQQHEIHLPAAKTKNKIARSIPILAFVEALLLGLREQGVISKTARVFPKTYSSSRISMEFGALCRGIGLDGVTMYTLRHTYGTRLAANGVSPFTIRDLMGHKSVRMTDRYVHVQKSSLHEAVQSLRI